MGRAFQRRGRVHDPVCLRGQLCFPGRKSVGEVGSRAANQRAAVVRQVGEWNRFICRGRGTSSTQVGSPSQEHASLVSAFGHGPRQSSSEWGGYECSLKGVAFTGPQKLAAVRGSDFMSTVWG